MAAKKPAKKGVRKSAKPAPAAGKTSKLFTDEERAAMREYAQERKRAARGGSTATFGFSDKAMLDEGHMWPNSFALMELTAAEETRIAALVKKAVGR